MLPQLLCTKKKLIKYIIKLDNSLYYLAAQIFDLKYCTAFLKDKDKIKITLKGEKKLYVV